MAASTYPPASLIVVQVHEATSLLPGASAVVLLSLTNINKPLSESATHIASHSSPHGRRASGSKVMRKYEAVETVSQLGEDDCLMGRCACRLVEIYLGVYSFHNLGDDTPPPSTVTEAVIMTETSVCFYQATCTTSQKTVIFVVATTS